MNLVASQPEDSVVILTEREREYLVRAIESGVQVRKRHQFFLWAQGQFRGVLPHELLACIHLDDGDQVVQTEFFHSCLLGDDQQDAICNPAQGLAIRLARLCRENGGPLLIAGGEGQAVPPKLVADFQRCGLRNALACTSEGAFGSSFVFILFDVEAGPSYRQAYFLELLLPHLQIALLRLFAPGDELAGLRLATGTRLITDRQIEILRLVQQGKSNHEIGALLGLSPLTVKNHVQKIYRKLNVQNRAHAVSRGISLRLLDSASG